jgi:hypothetical protein
MPFSMSLADLMLRSGTKRATGGRNTRMVEESPNLCEGPRLPLQTGQTDLFRQDTKATKISTFFSF